jgi:hypothetical protein
MCISRIGQKGFIVVGEYAKVLNHIRQGRLNLSVKGDNGDFRAVYFIQSRRLRIRQLKYFSLYGDDA